MSCVRQRLLEPSFRAHLSAMVRRRVPASEADDVVQSVMCDALAASASPASDADAGRFIGGIAKNKVADFHRRARRDARDAADIEDLASPRAAPEEARVILGAIAQDATPRAKETLEWIVREHAGEELSAIAKEMRLPAPVVRQRVSRMRRALRARWLGGALVLLLGVGLTAALSRERAPALIVADGTAEGAGALAPLQGEWRVEGTRLRARIEGAHLTVEAPGVHVERAIVVTSVESARWRATLRGDGREERVEARLDGARLVVRSGARTVVLVRAQR